MAAVEFPVQPNDSTVSILRSAPVGEIIRISYLIVIDWGRNNLQKSRAQRYSVWLREPVL